MEKNIFVFRCYAVIVKRYFSNVYEDIIDVKIYVNSFIEDIDHQCVKIRSLTDHEYHIKTFTMKGLNLIENVLWNCEKFLLNNTTHHRKH